MSKTNPRDKTARLSMGYGFVEYGTEYNLNPKA
jgi:uncharacterized protein YhjY with autotransporter beta-barrel domain